MNVIKKNNGFGAFGGFMEYYIPSNFEDNGKIAGLFGIRNVIEAGLLSLPFVYLSFTLVPGGLTWKTIAAAVFAKNVWHWHKAKKIYEYRGEVIEKGHKNV